MGLERKMYQTQKNLAKPQSIFDSALLYAIDLVALKLYDDLTDLYYLVGAWDHFNLGFRYNTQFLRELESKLIKILGEKFHASSIVKLKNLVDKPKKSHKPLEAGMPVASFPPDTEYTYDDLVLATNYGMQLSRIIIQKLYKSKKCKNIIDSRNSEDIKEAINFLESLLGVPITNIDIPEIIWEAPQAEPKVKIGLLDDKPVTTMATALPITYGLDVQMRPEQWQNSEVGAIYPEKTNKCQAEIIELYVTNVGDVNILPWDEAQQIIDKFGLNTAKLHLIFAACCMNLKEPWNDRFELTGHDVIKLLGWDKRTDESYSERLKEVAKLAFMLSCLLVKITWEEGKNKKGQIMARCPTGRIWEVTVTPKGQLNADGQIENFEEVVLTIRPGIWTTVYLNKEGHAVRTAFYQFGLLSKDVLKIDPYHNEMALRLALHLSLRNRCHKDARYKVGNLLKSILPKNKLDNAISDTRRGSELKQDWDKALSFLSNIGWNIIFEDSYPAYLQPGSNLERNPKGYLDILFEAIVIIRQPGTMQNLLNSAEELPPQPKSSHKHTGKWSGSKIRDFRKAKGWTQKELANMLGISQTLLQMVETNKRSIIPEVRKKLTQILKK